MEGALAMLTRDVHRHVRYLRWFSLLRPLALGFGLGQALTPLVERYPLWKHWSLATMFFCLLVALGSHLAIRRIRGPIYQQLRQRLAVCRQREGERAKHQ